MIGVICRDIEAGKFKEDIRPQSACSNFHICQCENCRTQRAAEKAIVEYGGKEYIPERQESHTPQATTVPTVGDLKRFLEPFTDDCPIRGLKQELLAVKYEGQGLNYGAVLRVQLGEQK